jgi:hypothetical protein
MIDIFERKASPMIARTSAMRALACSTQHGPDQLARRHGRVSVALPLMDMDLLLWKGVPNDEPGAR